MTDKPKVLIDARMVGETMHGMARYVSQLAEGIGQLESEPLYEPLFIVSKEWKERGFHGFGAIAADSPFLRPRELAELPLILRGAGAALYHSPTFSSLAWSPCPWVVTVHDLNHLTYGGLAEKAYYLLLLRRFARRASALVTVSEFSRREIAEWTGIAEAAIDVAYNAIDAKMAIRAPDAEIEKRLAPRGIHRGRYFICLSNPKPHKNVALLVGAFREYRRQGGDWPLVLSMNGFEGEPGVLPIGASGDDETRALLAGAGALVFPSLYEGFGLPPVEAAVMGVPVIVSDIAPHREGLVDLPAEEALWVAPDDQAGWTKALLAASRGQITPPSIESRSKTLQRFAVRNLGRHMDRIYRRVLKLEAS